MRTGSPRIVPQEVTTRPRHPRGRRGSTDHRPARRMPHPRTRGRLKNRPPQAPWSGRSQYLCQPTGAHGGLPTTAEGPAEVPTAEPTLLTAAAACAGPSAETAAERPPIPASPSGQHPTGPQPPSAPPPPRWRPLSRHEKVGPPKPPSSRPRPRHPRGRRGSMTTLKARAILVGLNAGRRGSEGGSPSGP